MKTISLKEIGKRIRDIRVEENVTQHDLYKKTGISTTQISAYENGKKSIGLQTLAKIASALGTSIDYIYFGPSEMKPISTAANKGELIVNCISSLFDEGVIASLYREDINDFVPMGIGHYYRIGFNEYLDILDDMVLKLDDFEKNKNNYPDPDGFKKQILASAVKQINDRNKKLK